MKLWKIDSSVGGGTWRSPVRWRRWMLALYVSTIFPIVIQKGFLSRDKTLPIYQWSFRNLVAGLDPYLPHPEQYADLFMYSPTFPLLFAPLAYLPFAAALLVWSLVNVLLAFYAVDRLLPPRQAVLALAILYLEVVRATQSAESNLLVAALIVIAFVAFERRRPSAASLAIVTGACIKLFPLAAVSFAIFHPRRIRFTAIFAGTLAVFCLLPLFVVSPEQLLHLYGSWIQVLARYAETIDAVGICYVHGIYGGVMQQIRLWSGVAVPNWPVAIAGTIVLLLPLLVRRREWAEGSFRLLFLCSVLVYVVLFNHAAESCTFVIAMTGIAIWFVTSSRSRLRTAFLALTLVVVSFSSTDLMPRWLQAHFFTQYCLKTIPCLIAWLWMQAELLGLVKRTGKDGCLGAAAW